MSLYAKLQALPDDPILKIPLLFKKDTRRERINLGIGAYQDEDGHAVVFKAVREAEKLLLQKDLNKEYLPIGGDSELCDHMIDLTFGKNSPIHRDLFVALQTVGASAALRIAGEFLAKNIASHIAIPSCTWSNHYSIFQNAGLQITTYPYTFTDTGILAESELYETLNRLNAGTVVLLQACCHNPSGCDPSPEQWRNIRSICRKRSLIPFFDFSYQGFGSDLELDAAAVRSFAEEGLEILVAVSFSKNFGLYGERIGGLIATLSGPNLSAPVSSHLKSFVRASYSSPPLHGAQIIDVILSSPALRNIWEEELNAMRLRVQIMRDALSKALKVRNPDNNSSVLARGKGFFAFSGLTMPQVAWIQRERAIYMPENGRINLAGLNWNNLEYVTDALVVAMKEKNEEMVYDF